MNEPQTQANFFPHSVFVFAALLLAAGQFVLCKLLERGLLNSTETLEFGPVLAWLLADLALPIYVYVCHKNTRNWWLQLVGIALAFAAGTYFAIDCFAGYVAVV